jgi:hypothetical protein
MLKAMFIIGSGRLTAHLLLLALYKSHLKPVAICSRT